MKRLAVFACLALAACGGTPADTATAVAQLQVALTTAERLAIQYVTLPECPKAPVCADLAVVARIKQADNVAYEAVKAARQSNTDATRAAAAAAIAGLTAVIPLK